MYCIVILQFFNHGNKLHNGNNLYLTQNLKCSSLGKLTYIIELISKQYKLLFFNHMNFTTSNYNCLTRIVLRIFLLPNVQI